jgi:hypothetical protein
MASRFLRGIDLFVIEALPEDLYLEVNFACKPCANLKTAVRQ